MNPMRTPRKCNRRGFTLIEAITAIVILAAAVPTTVLVLSDAASARASSIETSRAVWLAGGVLEQIILDVNVNSPGLGMVALADADTYLDTPDTGLRDRLELMSEGYQQYGMTFEVDIGPLVNASGVESGIAGEDVYRYVEVTVSWSSARTGAKELSIGALVTDING